LVRGFYLAGRISTFYLQNKWVYQRGLIPQDTGIDLAVKRDGKLYNAIIGERSS